MPLEELVSSVSGLATCSIEPNSFCFAIASSGDRLDHPVGVLDRLEQARACVNSSKPRSTIPWVARSSATKRTGAAWHLRGGALQPVRARVEHGHRPRPAEAHSAAQPQPMSPAPSR